MEVGQQIGDLVLTRLRPDGRWDALCACGEEVSRGTHALNTAVRDGLRSCCRLCNARRARDVRLANRDRRAPRALESLDPEALARVLRLTKGRTDGQVIQEAVELVRLGLDREMELRPTDHFRCDFAHRYRA